MVTTDGITGAVPPVASPMLRHLRALLERLRQARAAGKDSQELFAQLGDVRGQAAALLVQSHVAIKSKNQEGPRDARDAKGA